MDVTISLTKGDADVTTRAARGWKLTRATLKECEISFNMVDDPADPGRIAIAKAFFSDEPIQGKFFNEEFIEGTQGTGISGWWDVFDYSVGQPLSGAQTVDVKVKPTYVSTDPEDQVKWYENGVDITEGEGGTP